MRCSCRLAAAMSNAVLFPCTVSSSSEVSGTKGFIVSPHSDIPICNLFALGTVPQVLEHLCNPFHDRRIVSRLLRVEWLRLPAPSARAPESYSR